MLCCSAKTVYASLQKLSAGLQTSFENAVNNVYTELNLHSATKVNDAQQDSEQLTRKQRKKGAGGDR